MMNMILIKAILKICTSKQLFEYQYKELNAPFCLTELKDSLKNSNNTTVGPKNISPEMLKDMSEHCLHAVLPLLNTKLGLQGSYQCVGFIL